MKLFKTSIVLVSSFIIFSCEKEIKLDAEQIKSRIVVNSIFSANDTIKIHLSESRNILYNNTNGGKLPNITNATATLLDQNDNVLGTLTHTNDGKYYLASPFPQAGNTYKLKITHPDFDDVISKTFLPDIISITKIDTLIIGNEIRIKISIDDNANENNYYSILLYNQEINTYQVSPGVFKTDTSIYTNYICTKDINTLSSKDIDGESCHQELLFNDKTFNGSSYTFDVKGGYSEPFDSNYVVNKIVVLRSISEDLFKYRITMEKYQDNQGNPFGQPVQVYSNIEKGFGIFSGFSEFKETIVF